MADVSIKFDQTTLDIITKKNPFKGQFVTKYFDPKYKGSYEEGSIRLGTLQEYRSIEDGTGLFSDTGEGENIATVENSGYIASMHIPGGGSISNVTIGSDVKSAVGIHYQPINEWVFCSTFGVYNEEHHRQMVKGHSFDIDGQTYEYPENPNNTSYCVFDLAILIGAIKDCLLDEAEVGVKVGVSYSLMNYGERGRFRTVQDYAKPQIEENFTAEDYKNVVFTKPPQFSVEKEFRIVARPLINEWAPDDAEAMFLKSGLIRASLLEMGDLNLVD